MSETVMVPITRSTGAQVEETEDAVVLETPLTLYFNDEEIVTLLCSPAQIEELALGFLLSEGFIRDLADLIAIAYDPWDKAVFVKGKNRAPDEEVMSKRFLSACCGKSRASFAFANDARLAKPQVSATVISLTDAYAYAAHLQTLPLFRATGGVHSGGLAFRGQVLFTSYDIGRHNVFDKLFGQAFRARVNLADHVIFFSGRVSSEILLKVAKMNIPILVARSAPTDLALTLARDLNITIIGFARNDHLNIYTCPQRIITTAT
ncbi:protein FdhD [Peptococcaceae bacterium CEB3]|nr:protein FdhD [Peptococcaceae bacterium CEB3]